MVRSGRAVSHEKAYVTLALFVWRPVVEKSTAHSSDGRLSIVLEEYSGRRSDGRTEFGQPFDGNDREFEFD